MKETHIEGREENTNKVRTESEKQRHERTKERESHEGKKSQRGEWNKMKKEI